MVKGNCAVPQIGWEENDRFILEGDIKVLLAGPLLEGKAEVPGIGVPLTGSRDLQVENAADLTLRMSMGFLMAALVQHNTPTADADEIGVEGKRQESPVCNLKP